MILKMTSSNDPFLQRLIGNLVRMLSGDDDRIHANRLPIDILNRHLRFPIGSQEVEDLLLSHLGQPPGQPVGKDDGHGHQLRRLVTGITEHQPLIPRPLFMVLSFIHPLLDIGGLFVDGGDHGTGLPIEPHRRVIVSDLFDRLPDDGRHMDIAGSGDLSCDDRHSCRHQGLTGHPGIGVLTNDGIQDAHPKSDRPPYRDVLRSPIRR